MSEFVSFPLFGLIVDIKLRNFDFKSHWNTWIFLDKKDMISDLNMSHGKMSDSASLLFGFTAIIKLRNFDSENHWNALMFYDKQKYGVRFPWGT